MRTPRAIVFDLDGTLVDSLADIATHLNAALADHHLPAHAERDIRVWVGHGADQLVRHAVADPARVPAVFDAFRAHYRARPVIATHVYAGLPAVLDLLAPRCPLAVLSNKPHDLTVAICGQLLARWPIAAIVGDRPGQPRKPDPGGLLAVLAGLAIDPADAVLVGDSEIDVATARAAGVTSIAVTWGLRDEAILRAARPDHVVHAPAELAALLA